MKGFIEVTTHIYRDARETYWNSKKLIPIELITNLDSINGLYVDSKKLKTKESYEEIKHLIENAQ